MSKWGAGRHSSGDGRDQGRISAVLHDSLVGTINHVQISGRQGEPGSLGFGGGIITIPVLIKMHNCDQYLTCNTLIII